MEKVTIGMVFERVKKHLLTQNKESINDTGDCRYRGPGGTSCAIGCLLDDADYSPQFEGQVLDSSVGLCSAVAKSLGGKTLTMTGHLLLNDLQKIHDIKHPGNWRVELEITQTAFNKFWHLPAVNQ